MRPAADGTEHARGWEAEGVLPDGLPDGWRRHGRRAHLDLVERWIGEPSGRWLKTDLQEERSVVRSLLPDLRGHWVGIDIATTVVRDARACGVIGVASDVRQLPFADGTFDGVLSTSTLDHFDDTGHIVTSLVELARVLRPGGRLILTLDNPRNPLIRVRNALPRRWQRRTGLVPFAVGVTLDRDAGEAALRSAGFEVHRSEHLLHAPHVLGTRAAAWPWFERVALPRFDRLARTPLGHRSGHFVAFLASTSVGRGGGR